MSLTEPKDETHLSGSLIHSTVCESSVILSFILIFNASFYINYSCVQASLSSLLMHIDGLNSLQVGLTYLPYDAGCRLASYAAGKLPTSINWALPGKKQTNKKLGDYSDFHPLGTYNLINSRQKSSAVTMGRPLSP